MLNNHLCVLYFCRPEYSLFVGDLDVSVDDYTLYNTFAQKYKSCKIAKGRPNSLLLAFDRTSDMYILIKFNKLSSDLSVSISIPILAVFTLFDTLCLLVPSDTTQSVLLKYGHPVAKCYPWIQRATQGPTMDGPFGDQWIHYHRNKSGQTTP